MEEVSFGWVLYTISQGAFFLPVLDTYVFKEEKLFCEYTLHENILTRRLSFDSVSISSFISNTLNKFSIKNKLRRISEKICCIVTKNSKDFINYKDLKELSINHIGLSKISTIQMTKPNYFREIKTFVFKLTNNTGLYESTFSEKKENSLVPCKTRNYYEKAKDIINLVMVYIQTQRGKRVTGLTVEFISDDDFSLWILDVSECFVTDSSETQSLENLTEFERFMKKSLSFEGVKTNMAKLVKIASPTLVQQLTEESSDFDDQDETVEVSNFGRRNSIFKKDVRKKKVSIEEDNEKFNDFLEILSKTYAKFNAESTGKKVLQEDVDKEYKRIAGLLSPETESSRKHSQVSFNISPQASSPLFKNKHKNSCIVSSHNSRKASEIQLSKIPGYRIRILKTVKD